MEHSLGNRSYGKDSEFRNTGDKALFNGSQSPERESVKIFPHKGNVNLKPGSVIGAAGSQILQTQPFMQGGQCSFKATCDQLEQEIMQLAKENKFVRKEVHILKSEKETVEEVSEQQSADIKKYLQKETNILEDVIHKFNAR